MAELKPDENYNPIECRRLIRVSVLYKMLPSSEPMSEMAHQMELMLRDMTKFEQRAKQAEDDLSTYKSGQARDDTELGALAQQLSDARAMIETLKERAAAAPKGKRGKQKPEATKAPSDPNAPEIITGQSVFARR